MQTSELKLVWYFLSYKLKTWKNDKFSTFSHIQTRFSPISVNFSKLPSKFDFLFFLNYIRKKNEKFYSVTWFFTQKPSKKCEKTCFSKILPLKINFQKKKLYGFLRLQELYKMAETNFKNIWKFLSYDWKTANFFFTKTVVRGSLWVGSWPNT